MDKFRFGTDGDIIEYNLSFTGIKYASAMERRMAHLCELARVISAEILSASEKSDIMDAVCAGDEAKDIYNKYRRKISARREFIPESVKEEAFLQKRTSLFDSLYLCKKISSHGGKTYAAINVPAWLSDAETVSKTKGKEIKIAFLRGKQANAAFEAFAKYIFGVMPSGGENFSDVCESVYSGEADFGIIPVENSSDGRLGSFYRLIERYGLSVILSCSVPMPDGENYTKFALCARSMSVPNAEGEKVFHFRLTLDSLNLLSDVLDAGKYFGAEIKRADLLPFSIAGRENSLDIIFGIDNTDIAGLICFLKLEYPQFLPVGIYTEIGEGRVIQ